MYELIKGVREDHGAEGEIVEVCEGGSMVVDGFCDATGHHRQWWQCQFHRVCMLHGHDWVCDFTGKAYDSSGMAELLDVVELWSCGGYTEGECADNGTQSRYGWFLTNLSRSVQMRCLYRTLVPRDLNCLFVHMTAVMSRGTSWALQRRSSAVCWRTSWLSLSSTEECMWLCSHVSSESGPRRLPHSPMPSNNKSLPRPTFQRTPLHLESIQCRHCHHYGHYLRFCRRHHGLSQCSRCEFECAHGFHNPCPSWPPIYWRPTSQDSVHDLIFIAAQHHSSMLMTTFDHDMAQQSFADTYDWGGFRCMGRGCCKGVGGWNRGRLCKKTHNELVQIVQNRRFTSWTFS